MNSIEINNWQRETDVARIVKSAFPSYRRKKIYVRASETITFSDMNWSGGTRSEYVACTLQGEKVGDTYRYHALAPWDVQQIEGKSVAIPQGHCVVRGGHFCGKESIVSIYVNPADMPRYLAHRV